MSDSIRAVAGLFQISNGLFKEKIAGLKGDERIADTNPVQWLTGHLITSRNYLLTLLGDPVKLPEWAALFSKKYDPAADYPDMATLSDAWQAVADRLAARLEQVSPGELDRDIDAKFPNGDPTLRGAATFLAYHEGWHLGQIANVRRANGMDGLVPY